MYILIFIHTYIYLIIFFSKVYLRKRRSQQRVVIHLLVELGAYEGEAAVVPEGAPLDVDAHVAYALVRRLPVLHAARALHVAPVGASAHYYTDLVEINKTKIIFIQLGHYK